MGQKYEASLAFLVEDISSLLDLAIFTLFKSLQFNQARAQFQSTIQATSHKLIESKQCMQACQTLFYLQKGFIISYKHSKTLIGYFIKRQNYLQKILPINHFETKSIFYVVEKCFLAK